MKYTYLLGDYNARIGSTTDTFDGFDNIPDRHVLDQTINQLGHDFIDNF